MVRSAPVVQLTHHIRSQVKKLWPFSKQRLYQAVCLLDIVLISLIIINGIQPAKRLVSPLLSSVQQTIQLKGSHETFSFVPGWAPNKFDNISLNNLDYLAFFDAPIDKDGSIYKDGWGYQYYQSEEAEVLFERARSTKTKVLLTLTQSNPRYIDGILRSDIAQQTLISDVMAELESGKIDGVVMAFEHRGDADQQIKANYTQLIKNLADTAHALRSDIKVVVAIPSIENPEASIYDLTELTSSSDKLFAQATTFPVMETRSQDTIVPVYGYSQTNYWNDVGSDLQPILQSVGNDQIAVEVAWYGNGDEYPLYKPNTDPNFESSLTDPLPVVLDSQTLDRLVAGVVPKGREGARKNIPLIVDALREEGILDSNVLAYALATIEHETDETFEPIEEISGRMSARRLGYEGGTNYFGRGFIQLTHLRNYKLVGVRIGMGDELVKHPELASDPKIAARVLAAFFKDNNIANLASQGMFIAARRPVNPDGNGYKIALLAQKFWN